MRGRLPHSPVHGGHLHTQRRGTGRIPFPPEPINLTLLVKTDCKENQASWAPRSSPWPGESLHVLVGSPSAGSPPQRARCVLPLVAQAVEGREAAAPHHPSAPSSWPSGSWGSGFLCLLTHKPHSGTQWTPCDTQGRSLGVSLTRLPLWATDALAPCRHHLHWPSLGSWRETLPLTFQDPGLHEDLGLQARALPHLGIV